MTRRRIRLAAALAATLCALTTGCTSSGGVPAPPTLSAVNPLPPEAVELTTPPSAENSCDAEASLRPRAQPQPGAMPPGSAMAAIVANGKVRIGVDQNTYLFGFRDPASGELKGFDIDLAREIARDLFGDRNKIELRSVTAVDRIPALRNKQVDMIVRTFTATCERRRDVDFSSVYYRAPQRIVALKNSGIDGAADLMGKRVCVLNGSVSAAPLFAMPTRPTVLGVTNWTDCLVALQQNHVDAITGDAPIMYGLIEQDRNLTVVGDPIGAGAYAVGLPKGSDELVRFVNGVLERVRTDGSWQRMYNDRLPVLGPVPDPPTAKYVD